MYAILKSKTLNSLRHNFLEMRRATWFRFLKLAVNTYRPFVAICWSWRLRYRRPIPKANTHTPWLLSASAGLRTRSCEMPSVMTTRAWKEKRKWRLLPWNFAQKIDGSKYHKTNERVLQHVTARIRLISFFWLSSYKRRLPFAEKITLGEININ